MSWWWNPSAAGATSGGNSGPSNRITLLRHTNDDGVPDMQSVFLDHLKSPFGVALVGNDLNTDAIVRYPYKTGDMSITSPGETLTPLPGGPIDHHWTKSLVASPDGSKLYVGVGSTATLRRTASRRRKTARTYLRSIAPPEVPYLRQRVAQSNGLTFEPKSGALWAVVNERDEISPDLVPDYMTSVKDVAFYGWPYSYYGQHVDPRVRPQRPDLVEKAIPPDYALSSHVAPLGLVFDTGAGLPESYRRGAFVGEHGSWNRQVLNGYKVIFVPQ